MKLLSAVMIMVPVLSLAQPETQPPSKPGQPPRTNPNQPGKDPMRRDNEDPALRQELMSQEKKIWEAMKDQDWSEFQTYLANDFTLVCPQGFQTKTEAMNMARKGSVKSYTISDWRFDKLGDDSAVVMYKVSADMPGMMNDHRKPNDAQQPNVNPNNQDRTSNDHAKINAFATTIWTREGGKWVAQVHEIIPEDGGSLNR